MTSSNPGSSPQIKLAFLTLDFYPQVGGVQNYLFEISRRLGRNFNVLVITPEQGSLPPHTPLQKIAPAAPHALGFWQTLRNHQPDVVIVGHAHPQLLLAATLYRRGRYAAITYGNDYLAAQKRWHRLLFNQLLRQANPLMTISAANVERLEALDLCPTAVIHPGTDPQRFYPPPTRSQNALTLLTVARLVPRKGIDTLLRLLPQFLAGYPQLTYQIVGDGPDKPRLRQLCRELDVESHVQFLGKVSDDALPQIYRKADVFVMLTREEAQQTSVEGFGIVYLEASASGLPIVATRCGGVADAVRDGVTGLLVPPDAPEAAQQAIARLLADAELRASLGRAGRRLVEEELNWDQTAVHFQSAITAVLPAYPPKPAA